MKSFYMTIVIIAMFYIVGVCFAFTDVNNNNNHSEAIYYLEENKVLDGYPDGSFKSEASMTRAEFAKVVVLAKNLKINGDSNFELLDITGHWGEEFMKILVSNNFIRGYPDGMFKPDNIITCAEAITIVARLSGITENDNTKWPDSYIEFARERGMLENVTFNFGDENTASERGDIAELIYNNVKYSIAQNELKEQEKEKEKNISIRRRRLIIWWRHKNHQFI